WMTSGSGIMHEEMPQVRPEGIGGLQLWLNLPAREKMTRPKYRDLSLDHVPTTTTDGGAQVRVIAGTASDGRPVRPVEGLAGAPKWPPILPNAHRAPSESWRSLVPRQPSASGRFESQVLERRGVGERRDQLQSGLLEARAVGADEAVLPDGREDDVVGEDALDL